MTQTLTEASAPPEWIQNFSDEIDALAFGPGFERIDSDTEWSFGVRTGRGAEDLKAFFHQIDDALDTVHRLLEVWSSPAQHIVRGEADVTPKGEATPPVTVPFVWIFYMDPDDPDRPRYIYIVNGPVRTDAVL